MGDDRLKSKATSRFMEIFDSFIDGGEKYYVEFDEMAQLIEAAIAEDYDALSEQEKVQFKQGIESLNQFVAVKSTIEFAVVLYGKDFLEKMRAKFDSSGMQPSVELSGAMQALEAWYSIIPAVVDDFIDSLVSGPRELADNVRAMKDALKQTVRAAIEQMPFIIMPEADNLRALKKAMSAFIKSARK